MTRQPRVTPPAARARSCSGPEQPDALSGSPRTPASVRGVLRGVDKTVAVVDEYIDRGELGRTSGKGFYDYSA